MHVLFAIWHFMYQTQFADLIFPFQIYADQ